MPQCRRAAQARDRPPRLSGTPSPDVMLIFPSSECDESLVGRCSAADLALGARYAQCAKRCPCLVAAAIDTTTRPTASWATRASISTRTGAGSRRRPITGACLVVAAPGRHCVRALGSNDAHCQSHGRQHREDQRDSYGWLSHSPLSLLHLHALRRGITSITGLRSHPESPAHTSLPWSGSAQPKSSTLVGRHWRALCGPLLQFVEPHLPGQNPGIANREHGAVVCPTS